MSQTNSQEIERREIEVRGIVQGVGFRPFIYSLALRYGLAGWVRNDAAGVHIAVEGPAERLQTFIDAITAHAPPLAQIDSVRSRPSPPVGEQGFHIEVSARGLSRIALVSPDVATCRDCLAEVFDSADRRYRYPFINCTNCGPRFTITRSVPYDRASTTMAGFVMCPECRREYEDPANRRFHAQPNACPVCGPRVRLCDPSGTQMAGAGDPIALAAAVLGSGAILAVKGLGGYHLACDPRNAGAVRALRSRKARQDKPFALMARNLDQARTLAQVDSASEMLLTTVARPIVLMGRRVDDGIAEDVAPRQKTLGVMLAYTPLHHILLADFGAPLVMTSGNRCDEPIAYRDEEAFEQLGAIADYFLVHNRPIHVRCDDSVARAMGGWSANPPPGPLRSGRGDAAAFGSVGLDAAPSLLRRSRGYAPRPIDDATGFARPILAVGGQLKNTFCLARGAHAFMSHHIGDLDNYETLRSFTEGIEHFGALFDVRAEAVAYDLHPEYVSTRYARELEDGGMPAIGVQHHHAHIASCLADNNRPRDQRVIGVAMDGTGYGTDGTIWGGEFFAGSVRDGFERRAHLASLPLPGGEAAIRHPYRSAIACLVEVYGLEEALSVLHALPGLRPPGVAPPGVENAGLVVNGKPPLGKFEDPAPRQSSYVPTKPSPREKGGDLEQGWEREVRLISQMVGQGINSPRTSSAGRLFDVVAAILGLPGTRETTYEGQAAIELDLASAPFGVAGPHYPMPLREIGVGPRILETSPLIRAVATDVRAGKRTGEIAWRFHDTLSNAIARTCGAIRRQEGLDVVAVSGGTFQNALLLELTLPRLDALGFTVYRHERVPTNDGGLALGQAVLADEILRKTDAMSTAH